jgi:hypothetical protein
VRYETQTHIKNIRGQIWAHPQLKNTHMSGAKHLNPQVSLSSLRERKWAVVNAVMSQTENISKVVGD